LLILGPASSTWADEDARKFLKAAREGNVAAVRELLEKHVDVNVQTPFGATALAYAAEHGYLELTRVLVTSGADITLRDPIFKRTPAIWASQRGHLDILQILVQAGAREVDTAIVQGAEAGHIGLVKAVLSGGAPDPRRVTEALVFAEQNAHSDIVELLKQAGAQPLPDAPVAVPKEKLEEMAGTYLSRELGLDVVFRRFGPILKGAFYGQEEFTYVSVADTLFRAYEVPDLAVEFEFVNDRCVGAIVTQANTPMIFDRLGRRRSANAYRIEPGKQVIEDAPAAVEKPLNWPQFRGPRASGIADGQHPPVYWDVASGRNIRWKTPIPGLGHASPIIWGERVYVVTAVPLRGEPDFAYGRLSHVDIAADNDQEQQWRLYSIDKNTGAIVWERTLHQGVPRVKRHRKSSYANPTPATDGKHLVVCAGSEGLFGYDMEGKLLWENDLGIIDTGWFYDPSYPWGNASSPIIFNDRVYVQCDKQEGSFIAAYDVATGKELWKTAREEVPSWSTPTIVEYDGKTELVTNGSLAARGYDPDTGAELWRSAPGSLVAMPTPVFADDLTYISSGYFIKSPGGYWGPQPIYAVRFGARGDISLQGGASKNHAIAWSMPRSGTYIPTPIVYGDFLYTADFDGALGCYDRKTGLLHPRVMLGGCGAFSASPVAADGRLYSISEEGEVFVTGLGPEMKPLAINFMGEPTLATPAISDGMIFVRTIHHLYGIGYTDPAGRATPTDAPEKPAP